MTKKILCRADGNATTGLGHLYRMLAIIAFYKDDFEIVFVTQETSTANVIPEAITTAFIPKNITVNDEPAWLQSNFSPKDYIVFADGYQFKSDYQKQLKDFEYSLLYVDDLMAEHMYADVVVNHAPAPSIKNYKAEKYTRFALGTKYAMLRPSFNEIAKLDKKASKIENVFVCFGGSDQYDLSLKAVQALLNLKVKHIHLVVGAAYKSVAVFELERNNESLTIYKNVDEVTLSNIMQSCQMAIAPASTILYEVCSIKMAVLSGYYVENQKQIYKGLVDKNVVFPGDDFSQYTVEDFENKIQTILNSSEIDAMLANQHQLFDGRNKARFLGLTNALLLSFRVVNINDVMTVYNWSNDPLVRQNSYYQESIPLDGHKKWYTSKLNNPNTLFLIAEVNGKPVGLVRYEVEEAHAVVGILIDPKYRGQKLATPMLEKSAITYFKRFRLPVLAYIKNKNFASVKAFKQAGYNLLKETVINEIPSFVYKLEK